MCRLGEGAWLLVPLVCLFLEGCAIFQSRKISKTDSLSVAVQAEQGQWGRDSLGVSSRTFSFVDSSGHEYLAEIVPSGAFSFSAEKGFSGQASVLRLRGKVQSASRGMDSLNQGSVLHESASVGRQSEARQEESSVSREPGRGASWAWFFVILAVLAALLWLLKGGVMRRI